MIALAGPSRDRPTHVVEHHGRMMASELQLVLVGALDRHATRAVDLLAHLERRWSRFLVDSDISVLNRSSGTTVRVDPSTAVLVERMVAGWVDSGGWYDPTLLPELVDAGYVASVHDDRSVTARPATGLGAPDALLDVEIDHRRRTVTLPPGVSLDPGGIGKGLAADLAVESLLDDGVCGALVSLGGDLRAEGTPPTDDGWVVRVEDPFDPATDLLVLAVDGGGVCTSSTRSRSWMQGGVPRHHLIDPRTRQPAATDLVSATVVAGTAAEAEVSASSAMLMGGAAASAELDAASLPAVLTAVDGRTWTSRSVPRRSDPAGVPG